MYFTLLKMNVADFQRPTLIVLPIFDYLHSCRGQEMGEELEAVKNKVNFECLCVVFFSAFLDYDCTEIVPICG